MDQETPEVVDHPAVCRELRELKLLIDKGKEELDALKEDYKELQLTVASAFQKAGVRNLVVDDRRHYIHRAIFVNKKAGVTTDEVRTALVEAELPGFLTQGYSSSGLRAHVMELDKQAPPGTPLDEVLPEPLRPLFNTHEERKVTSAAAAKAS